MKINVASRHIAAPCVFRNLAQIARLGLRRDQPDQAPQQRYGPVCAVLACSRDGARCQPIQPGELS